MPCTVRQHLVLGGLIVGLLVVGASPAEIAIDGKQSVPHVPRFGVFAQTLRLPMSAGKSDQVTAKMTLMAPSGRIVAVYGFNRAADLWTFRFAPSELGAWKWSARVVDGPRATSARGRFVVVRGRSPGFVRKNPNNRLRWIFQTGAPYYPIGINDCTLPVEDPLKNWGFDGGFRNGDHRLNRYVDMATYMSAYSRAGFNLFRWGPDNCSFSLYDRIDPRGNTYSLQGGQNADRLFSTLRRYGFRIEMVLFGFSPPFGTDSGDDTKMAAIERYVKYVVARYGAYVDFWELMNEATVSTGWYTKVGGYLRKVDPYHHPIGTSWSRPDLPTIDFGSDHWYQTEKELDSDRIAWEHVRQEQAARFGKPTLIDEQGNGERNWDPRSAVRMRLRTWTTFFAEGTFVFWNASFAKDYTRSPANIYLGPEERRYIRVLQNYTRNFDPRARIVAVSVSGRPDIRGYALRGPREYGLYLVAGKSHTERNFGVRVTVDTQRGGLATWIDPVTGRSLARATVKPGKRMLVVPPFTTDIALKIAPG